tara:strand:+ start:2544 stop:2921 length:378 start_codon:yes stop_codon:yes gene_type:complete
MNKTEQHKKAIIEALEKSLGVVTTACLKVGIGRTQFYNWLKQDKKFASKVDDIQNIAIDFAESQLYKQIGKGNTVATIFYLKTKGKHRGYIERIQTEHISDREPVEVRIVMPKNEDKGNDKLSED